jgi:hypothetical protein
MRRDQCPGQLRVGSDYDAEWARRHVSPSGYNHVGELIKMFEESEVGKAALRRIREEEAQGEQ